MSTKLPAISIAALTLVSAAAAQGFGFNEKTLYNGSHTTSSVRLTTNRDDTFYYVQPGHFRTGHGSATGFRVVIQDEEQSTQESVSLGFVRLVNGRPDTTTGGSIVLATYKLFGLGSGRAAFQWTLTLRTKVQLPSTSAFQVVLPTPMKWPTDGATIHHQKGSSLKLPPSVTPAQWTFALNSQGALVVYSDAGTTLRVGGLYDEPVLGVYIKSKAYGVTENLFGPELLYPDSSRGDQLGFYVNAARFANQFGIVMISPKKLTSPLSTAFGVILIDPLGVIAIPVVLALDNTGSAMGPTVPVPAKTTFWSQGAVLDFTNLKIRTTDASGTQIQ